jgi:hypothetical protein
LILSIQPLSAPFFEVSFLCRFDAATAPSLIDQFRVGVILEDVQCCSNVILFITVGLLFWIVTPLRVLNFSRSTDQCF